MYIAFKNDQQTNSVPIHGSLVIWLRVLSKSFEIELLNGETFLSLLVEHACVRRVSVSRAS